MSGEATGWVFRNSPYTGDKFVVHLAIADSVSDLHDNEFWMRIPSLAAKARCSVRSVQSALRELEQNGFIVALEKGGGRGKSSRYRVVLEKVQDLHPLSETVQPATETVKSTTIAPITEPKEPKEGVLPTFEAVRLGRAPYPPEFLEAWAAYPKRGDNKRAAFKAWLARAKEHPKDVSLSKRLEALTIASRNYAVWCANQGTENQFIKNGATFYGPSEPWKDFYRRKVTAVDDYDDSGARRITKEEMEERERRLRRNG